jgi:biotin-dependent carboxylase-like uncharacterized protein
MIELLSSGFYTSIQDHGRFGYTNFGVPVSGAMDSHLSELANLILGNALDEALIEMTLNGPKLKFRSSVSVSVCAFEAKVYLNGKAERINHQIKINPDDVLEVKQIKTRAYLAVSGGLDTELKLGSRSQYEFITKTSRLRKGDWLKLNKKHQDFSKKHASIKFDLNLYKKNTIYVYPLPEYYKLNTEQQTYLTKQFFSISNQSNRMAYQLNEPLQNELRGIQSTPVMPGTVQLTPEGKLIILMRDAQVTGGYPRIFQVSASSLNVLAQMSANQSLKFQIKHQFYEIY